MPVVPIPVAVAIPAVIAVIPSVPVSKVKYYRREPGSEVEGIVAAVIITSVPGIIPAPVIIDRRIV
jgi:hypothetical protein